MPKGAHGYVKDSAASLMIIGYVPLLGSFAALILAGENGPVRIVTFLLIVIMGDTGGYVAGVLFGRHPMAPKISPKKTWEGLVGSVLFGTVAGVLMTVYALGQPFWVGIVLGVCLVAIGTCGDLIESLIKRDLGIKDMSSFLPGHGGVMDRLDSLLIAAPGGLADHVPSRSRRMSRVLAREGRIGPVSGEPLPSGVPGAAAGETADALGRSDPR